MLFKRHILDGILEGRISLAFRKWKRPTVKTGGTLRTAVGVLAIKSVAVIDESQISNGDAKRAGFESREELLAGLNSRRDGQLYRIRLQHVGADPRQELREDVDMTDADVSDVQRRLARMDARSTNGAWTSSTLRLIAENPGKRTAGLADSIGLETKRFKTNVRKLKELGLTESLRVGYRLSPRGEVILNQLQH